MRILVLIGTVTLMISNDIGILGKKYNNPRLIASSQITVSKSALTESPSMFEAFSEKARRMLFFARYEAKQMGDYEIRSYHLLLAIIRDDYRVLRNAVPYASKRDITSRARDRIQDIVGTREPLRQLSLPLRLSLEVRRVLERSAITVRALSQRIVETRHILVSIMLGEDEFSRQVLEELGLDLLVAYAQLESPVPIHELRDYLNREEKGLLLLSPDDLKFLHHMLITP